MARGRARFRAIVIVAAFAGATGAVSAEAEWVVGGYLGAAHTSAAELSLKQPGTDTNTTFASIDYDGKSFSSPLYYGYRLAYFLPRVSVLGIEGELIHLKVYARTDAVTRVVGRLRGTPIDRVAPVGDVLEQFSISHGLNFAVVNLVVRRAVPWREATDSRIVLVGRVGIGPTIPHAESRIGGAFHQGYELGAPGVQAAGGISVKVLRGLAAIGEYKFTTTNQSVTVVDGQAQGRFTSHHGVFGLAWHF